MRDDIEAKEKIEELEVNLCSSNRLNGSINSEIEKLKKDLSPKTENMNLNDINNFPGNLDEDFPSLDIKLSISPLNKIKMSMLKDLQIGVKKKLSFTSTKNIGVSFSNMFKPSSKNLKILTQRKFSRLSTSPLNSNQFKDKPIKSHFIHNQEIDSECESVNSSKKYISGNKSPNKSIKKSPLKSPKKNISNFVIDENDEVKLNDKELILESTSKKAQTNSEDLTEKLINTSSLSDDSVSNSCNSESYEIKPSIEIDSKIMIKEEDREISTKKQFSVSQNSSMEYYSEEDMFLEELDENTKKYYVSAMDNFYGNYTNYIVNALMMTTTLPTLEYFTQEINKKRKNFKLSPYKKLLILDIDETLIHTDFDYKFESHSAYLKMILKDGEENILPINIRPYMYEFLEFSAKYFDIVLFTASCKEYAETILNYIDPEKKYIKDLFCREDCVVYKNLYLKFIEIFDVPLKDCIIVDNSVFSFAFNLKNGILVTSFYDEEEDIDLLSLKEYFEGRLVKCHDVRDVIEDTFKFQKIFNDIKSKGFDAVEKELLESQEQEESPQQEDN